MGEHSNPFLETSSSRRNIPPLTKRQQAVAERLAVIVQEEKIKKQSVGLQPRIETPQERPTAARENFAEKTLARLPNARIIPKAESKKINVPFLQTLLKTQTNLMSRLPGCTEDLEVQTGHIVIEDLQAKTLEERTSILNRPISSVFAPLHQDNQREQLLELLSTTNRKQFIDRYNALQPNTSTHGFTNESSNNSAFKWKTFAESKQPISLTSRTQIVSRILGLDETKGSERRGLGPSLDIKFPRVQKKYM
eukprot:TRINITY_DN14642_c0_g1_i1.p1 TRINITY_DN14642_c0_g1~~TRINITY_DN14642_c0_g1_i1.p1  ORF type:complete len:251 (+),score=51.88 TRINITY_DN14642_c0_g1_i1:89-841(+)